MCGIMISCCILNNHVRKIQSPFNKIPLGKKNYLTHNLESKSLQSSVRWYKCGTNIKEKAQIHYCCMLGLLIMHLRDKIHVFDFQRKHNGLMKE